MNDRFIKLEEWWLYDTFQTHVLIAAIHRLQMGKFRLQATAEKKCAVGMSRRFCFMACLMAEHFNNNLS